VDKSSVESTSAKKDANETHTNLAPKDNTTDRVLTNQKDSEQQNIKRNVTQSNHSEFVTVETKNIP